MRILELTLLAADVRAMRAFYGDRLGLPLARATATTVAFDAGATRLVFERAGPGVRPTYHFAFNVRASRFDEAVRWIGRHARVLGDERRTTFHFPSWNADAVYFEDPAGNVVELIARHGLREATPRRGETERQAFDARDISGVSEIGLPVRAVERTARFLAATTDTPIWDRGSGTFTALGDDHGLFIVVANARGWYPVGRPAEMHPVVLTIEGPRERRLAVPDAPYLIVMRPPSRRA